MRVGFSDSGPTLFLVQGRAKPVLHGSNSTKSYLLHHGETTHKVGGMSENPTLVLYTMEPFGQPHLFTCGLWRDGLGLGRQCAAVNFRTFDHNVETPLFLPSAVFAARKKGALELHPLRVEESGLATVTLV